MLKTISIVYLRARDVEITTMIVYQYIKKIILILLYFTLPIALFLEASRRISCGVIILTEPVHYG